MHNRLLLPDAARLKLRKDKTPYAYILHFSDGTKYIGSASGIYRLCYYRSIAQGTYPSLTKNPLLVTALKTLLCHVSITWCTTLDEARAIEKQVWIEHQAQGTQLLNCREFGQAGKWVQQSASTYLKRIATLQANGRHSLTIDRKLPDGRSRKTIKAIISRAINFGKPLTSVKGLSPELFAELTAEIHANAQ